MNITWNRAWNITKNRLLLRDITSDTCRTCNYYQEERTQLIHESELSPIVLVFYIMVLYEKQILFSVHAHLIKIPKKGRVPFNPQY